MKDRSPGSSQMVGLRQWIERMSLTVAVLAAVLSWAVNAEPSPDRNWALAMLVDNRSELSIWFAGLTVVSAILTYWRDRLIVRHSVKPALEKILDDLAREHFEGREHHNRFTIFKETRGWKLYAYALFWMPVLEFFRRQRYLFPFLWAGPCLAVYARPTGARNRGSSTAWRIGSHEAACEGVAGRVWASGSTVFLKDLPSVPAAEVGAIRRFDQVVGSSVVGKYVSRTNIKSLGGLRASRTYARHFFGTVIKRGYGDKWGVLLIDSTAEECPFDEHGEIVSSVARVAKLIGRFVQVEGDH